MGRSFCTEKTGFGISEFLSFCDVAFCATFRGHGNVGPNHIDVTWYSGSSSDHVLSLSKNTWLIKMWVLGYGVNNGL